MEINNSLDIINDDNNIKIDNQNVENDDNIENINKIKQNNGNLNEQNIDENINLDEDSYTDDEDVEIITDIKEDFITKIQNFLFRKKIYCVAFGLLTVFYLFFLLINGVFTGRKTIFVSDSFAQVGVYFSHIFKFFRGEVSLFYTNFYGKGFEIFSTLQYMYFNPFYLIILLGGETLIYEMFTISVYFMLVFTLFIFLWFSEKYFKNIDSKIRVLLSFMYVFSPFLNYNYSFVSWFIYPAVSLILVDRFLNFIKTGKLFSFIAVFVWYVVSCFSVGISTAIVLFVLFILYVYIVIEKDERKEKITDLFIVFVTTALISATLLIPSIIDVFASNRTSSFIKNLMEFDFDTLQSKFVLITSDCWLIVFAVYYFIKCDKKDKLNKYLMVAFVVTFMPIIFDAVMKVLCFSSYNGFIGRFYFLNEVVIIIPTLFIFDKKMWKFVTCNGEKFAKILMEFLMTIMVLFITILLIFNYKDLGQAVKNPLIINIGVAKINLGVLLIGVIFIGLCWLFNLRKAISDKFVKISIILMMVISLSFNCFQFVGGSSNDINERNYIESVLKSAGISGNIKYHNISDASYILDKSSDIRQTSVFSSLTPKTITSSYQSLGYFSSTVSYIDNYGTLLSDSLNGIEYYLSKQKMDRPYLEEITLTDNSKYYLYKNNLATNGTFVIDSDFSFDGTDAISNFEKLKEYYGITGTLIEEVDASVVCYDDEENEIVNADLSSDDIYKQKVTFKATKSGILYINTHLVSDEIEEDGLHSHIINSVRDEIYLDMAYLNAGEEYTFYLYKYSSLTDLNKIKYRFLDYEVAKQVCEKVINTNSSYKYNKTGYDVNVTADKDCNLYIMTPNIDGLSYTLNNQKVEINEILGSMVCVNIKAGNNIIVAKYKYPHTITWLLVLVVCIIIVALLFVLKKYGLLKILEKPIYYAMTAVFVILIVIVYLGGIVFSIMSLF